MMASILFAAYPAVATTGQKQTDRNRKLTVILVISVYALVIWTCFYVPAYATGERVRMRVLVATCMLFLLGWFGSLTAVMHCLKSQPLIRLSPSAASIGVLLLSVLMLKSNLVGAVGDLRSRLAPFDQTMRMRYEMLEQTGSRGQGLVEVPPIDDWPYRYQSKNDITEDPDYWANRAVARYFGVDGVKVESPAARRE